MHPRNTRDRPINDNYRVMPCFQLRGNTVLAHMFASWYVIYFGKMFVTQEIYATFV